VNEFLYNFWLFLNHKMANKKAGGRAAPKRLKLKPPKKDIVKQSYPIFKGIFFGLIFAGLFSAVVFVFAVPPDSVYNFSETLSPSCTPGSTNCTVQSPAAYSFGANNFSGTGTFTTTGIGTFGGATDTKQLVIKANASQTNTNPLAIFYKSDGTTELFRMHSDDPTNIFVGAGSGVLNMVNIGENTGLYNTAFGQSALSVNTSGISNTALGRMAMQYNTTGRDNVAVGGLALRENTTGNYNTALGFEAMRYNTTGIDNTALGNVALKHNTIGMYNTATAEAALHSNTTGSANTVSGYWAMYYNTTGGNNTAAGYYAGAGAIGVSNISNNSLFGYQSGYVLRTGGNNNTLIGYKAGDNITTGSSNIVLGYDIDAPSATSTQTLNIGNLIFATGLNGTGTTISTGKVGIGTTSPTYLLSLGGDAARQIWMERNTTTSGSNLTLQAGGGLSGGTNLSGGSLNLSSGISTGSGSSDMFFQTATAGASAITDRTPSTKFTVRGNGNVVVGTGTALATTATAGFLYIPTSAGTQTGTPVADTTGTAPIAYDTTNNRLYIYNPTGTPVWKYIAITGGFQIPDYETVDPISGEKIKEGDIVLGMINQKMEDEALHGVWVTWNSVKKQLLAEARGELSKTTGQWGSGTVEGIGTETFLDKIKNILFSLGISVKDGLVSIANLAVEKLSVKNARVETLEMVDSTTGDIYCTWIADGQWQKVKGECNSVATAVAVAESAVSETAQTSAATPVSSETAQQAQQVVQQAQETANQAQQAANNALETSQNAQQAVEQQVQQVVQQAAETASKSAKEAVNSVKEQIKQEVKQELQQEAQEAALTPEASAPEATTPASEVHPEQPAPASSGTMIRNAAAGLIKSMLEFVRWIFGTSFNEAGKIVPEGVKESSAGLMQKANDFSKNMFSADFKTISSGIKSTAAAILYPVQKMFIK